MTGLFQPDRDALLDLLAELAPADWECPTACAAWSVKDVALHVLGGDLGNIAIRRDGVRALSPRPEESLAGFLNRINAEWVEAARRLSPRLLVEMLADAGPRLFSLLESLDLEAIGEPVSWAGPAPAPVWLDVAREYTERWVHQQQIRDAVGRPGQRAAPFFGPVVATFMHALPPALIGADAPEGASVAVQVEGEAGGDWAVSRQRSGWALRVGRPTAPLATVRMTAETAWRLFTLGLTEVETKSRLRVAGDAGLAERVSRAVAIIA